MASETQFLGTEIAQVKGASAAASSNTDPHVIDVLVTELIKALDSARPQVDGTRFRDAPTRFLRIGQFIEEVRDGLDLVVLTRGDPTWDTNYRDIAIDLLDLLDAIRQVKGHVASLRGVGGSVSTDTAWLRTTIGELRLRYQDYDEACGGLLARLGPAGPPAS